MHNTHYSLWIQCTISIVISLFLSIYSPLVFSFHDSKGQIITSSDFKNKWIIVNYWADWCDSCLEEVPELNNFFKNNRDSNIVIVGVNYDQLTNPALSQAIKRAGILFPVLQEDPMQMWQLSEITVLPTTFIINPEGIVIRKIIGPNTEQSLLKIIHNKLYGKKHDKGKKLHIG